MDRTPSRRVRETVEIDDGSQAPPARDGVVAASAARYPPWLPPIRITGSRAVVGARLAYASADATSRNSPPPVTAPGSIVLPRAPRCREAEGAPITCAATRGLSTARAGFAALSPPWIAIASARGCRREREESPRRRQGARRARRAPVLSPALCAAARRPDRSRSDGHSARRHGNQHSPAHRISIARRVQAAALQSTDAVDEPGLVLAKLLREPVARHLRGSSLLVGVEEARLDELAERSADASWRGPRSSAARCRGS